jgi:DNA helicase-2/ATP-dependent DNA helicase PcrA
MRELEEERRLLYVAVTRAEKHCILTCAQNRFRYGRMEYDTPSRFIKDFDPQLIRVLSENGSDDSRYTRGYRQTSSRGRDWVQNPRPVATQFKADAMPRFKPSRPSTPPPAPVPSTAGETSGQLREGCTIEHQRFGIGTVTRIEGSGENQKATVAFKNAGTKQLLLKFARYKVIS